MLECAYSRFVCAATFRYLFLTSASVLGLTIVANAPAELHGIVTVERLACASDIIVVGELTNALARAKPNDLALEMCALHITEVIKGQPGAELIFSHYVRSKRDETWRTKGNELLVFLRYAAEQDGRGLRRQLIPTEDRDQLSIIDLPSLQPMLYDRTGSRLKDRAALLALVREWAGARIKEEIHRDAEIDSDADRESLGADGVWLLVPAEEKYRDFFMRQAHSPKQWDRREAAQELWKFPGPATVQVLRALLDDVSENDLTMGGDITIARFPVRAAALESLEKLGEKPPPLPLQRTTTAEERRKLHEIIWTDRFRRNLPPGCRVLAVRDGPSTALVDPLDPASNDGTIVIVTIGKDALRYDLTLVPMQWPPEDLPAGRRLGDDSLISNGARVFFCPPTMPAELQMELVRRWKLTEPKLKDGKVYKVPTEIAK